MYYVYVLELKRLKDRYYFGYSSNLKKRFEEHGAGKVTATKSYLPVSLVYYEAYEDEAMARRREASLKNSGSAYVGLMKRLGLLR